MIETDHQNELELDARDRLAIELLERWSRPGAVVTTHYEYSNR